MELKYLNHEEFNINPVIFDPFIKRLEGEIETFEGVLNVIFVTDTYIQALNKIYRQKDKTTDVLSFNYENDDQDSDLMGEVYLSVETCRRQAVDHHHSFEDELIKLIIHGILHVHGFDHEEDGDYKEMYAIEKAVLGKIAGEYMA